MIHVESTRIQLKRNTMNENKGLVSVIIPVYNRTDLLREAVESAIAQTYRPIEIVIVDDGSTDDTNNVAKEIEIRHKDIVRVYRKENEGPGLAREYGRQRARGEYIQYLDSDDLIHPGKLAVQVAALEANPDCGIAYGKTRLVAEDGSVIVSPFKRSGERIETLFPMLLIDRWWSRAIAS